MLLAEFPSIPQWFAIGTLPFWGLLGAWVLITLVAAKKQAGIVATVAFGVFLLALQFMSGLDLIGLIKSNWIYVFPIFALWLVFSIGWTFFRWRNYAHERTDLLNEYTKAWKAEGKSLETEKDIESFRGQAQQKYRWRDEVLHSEDAEQPVYERLLLSKNKARWSFWFFYAVFDAPVWVLWDSMIAFGKAVYLRVAGSLQAISDKIYDAKVEDKNVLK